MAQDMYQRIAISFNTSQALRDARDALVASGFANIETVVQPVVAEDLQELELKPGMLQGAIATGLLGAIAGGMIVTIALLVPNFSSLTSASRPLLLFVPLAGALLGATAGALMTYLSGADPDPSTPAQSSRSIPPYQLVVETPLDRVPAATEIVKRQSGQIL